VRNRRFPEGAVKMEEPSSSKVSDDLLAAQPNPTEMVFSASAESDLERAFASVSAASQAKLAIRA
jgi:hypothetical protein